MPNDTESTSVAVTARGDVTDAERAYAAAKIEHLNGRGDRPVLFRRVELMIDGDPAREQRAEAKAEIDLNGLVVRAHVAAKTMTEAIDGLEARMRARLERANRRDESRHLRFRGEQQHEWRHAQASPPRPPVFPATPDEREIVRRKTFALAAMTPDEAVDDLEALDHDFYLFENLETGDDNVIARAGDGYELHEPGAHCSLEQAVAAISRSPLRVSALTLDDARTALDATDRLFVFFIDSSDGDGRVLYRRYDGDYGLISPASSETIWT